VKSLMAKITLVAFVVILAIRAVFTGSRGIVAGYVMGFVIIVITAMWRTRLKQRSVGFLNPLMKVLVPISIAGAILVLARPLIQSGDIYLARRFAPYSVPGGRIDFYTSFTARWMATVQVTRIWLNNPLRSLIGYGPTTSTGSEVIRDVAGPVMIAFRYGLLGLVGFFWFCILMMQKAWLGLHIGGLSLSQEILAMVALAFVPSWFVAATSHFTFMADIHLLASVTCLAGLLEVGFPVPIATVQGQKEKFISSKEHE
jgi:hypothetical protein